MATVGTEYEVLLAKGSRGIIPCDVDTDDTIATVDWRKGSAEAQPSITLANFDGTWGVDGPRYVDGSYDMDLDFSLIIKNVSVEDNNDFFCRVLLISSGFMRFNQTIVSVYCK